jgi:hypothetical protein
MGQEQWLSSLSHGLALWSQSGVLHLLMCFQYVFSIEYFNWLFFSNVIDVSSVAQYTFFPSLASAHISAKSPVPMRFKDVRGDRLLLGWLHCRQMNSPRNCFGSEVSENLCCWHLGPPHCFQPCLGLLASPGSSDGLRMPSRILKKLLPVS